MPGHPPPLSGRLALSNFTGAVHREAKCAGLYYFRLVSIADRLHPYPHLQRPPTGCLGSAWIALLCSVAKGLDLCMILKRFVTTCESFGVNRSVVRKDDCERAAR